MLIKSIKFVFISPRKKWLFHNIESTHRVASVIMLNVRKLINIYNVDTNET